MNTSQIYRDATTPPKPEDAGDSQISPDELNRKQAIRMEYESWIQHIGTQKFIQELLKAKQNLQERAMLNCNSPSVPQLLHRAKVINNIVNYIIDQTTKIDLE